MTAPTKPTTLQDFVGLPAALAGLPQSSSPRGGMETGFTGTTAGGSEQTAQPEQQPDQFAGMGPLLEQADPKEVFKQIDGLVRRQELLARNRLAQDKYYACVVAGYPWASLKHDTVRDVYEFALPYGVSSISVQAVPNKNLDLVNKTAATLLADFPEPDAEPIDDSEDAKAAADMANRFLHESSGEQGTNDPVLFEDRVKRALACASSFIEGWVDPTGGGYVPLQIKAHPQAVDPNNALLGQDGMPTTDPVLRYVTAAPQEGPDGQLAFPPGTQFTDDPSQAPPQWQPKIMGDMWQREHLRIFPEDVPVHLAEKVIILGYCTISRARKRWPIVNAMSDEQINKLSDWTPPRYLDLLPGFQRARWKLTDGREKQRGGSSDERLIFYYHEYDKSSPDYPKGADIVVSGANGGTILSKGLLATPVEVKKGQTTTKEIRCREIPVVQVTPRIDPYGRDPTGICMLEMIVGATENNAHLAMGYAEALDKTLKTPFACTSTSPIDGDQVENARATGDMLVVYSKDDMPQQLPPPVLPTSFFEMYGLTDESVNSIFSQERAAQGAENSKERSGRALQIAIGRNTIANTPMSLAVNNAVARWGRIKLELAMAHYTTPQMIRYTGEDGAYKQAEFTGVDFSLVGNVSVKAGTGTMLAPDQKVEYLGQLVANHLLGPDEAIEAARPAFSKRLGLPANVHEQRVERALETWRRGPPSPEWEQQYAVWQQAQVQFEQQQAQFQSEQQRFQQSQEIAAVVAGGPPPTTLGPEQQNDEAMVRYQQAVIAQRFNPLPTMPPQAPQPPQVQKPWSPFTPRPNDTEPQIAAIWLQRMSKAMSSVEYEKASPGWRDDFTRQYMRVRQAVATASAAGGVAPQPQGQQPQPGQQQGGQAPTQPHQPTPATKREPVNPASQSQPRNAA